MAQRVPGVGVSFPFASEGANVGLADLHTTFSCGVPSNDEEDADEGFQKETNSDSKPNLTKAPATRDHGYPRITVDAPAGDAAGLRDIIGGVTDRDTSMG